MEARSEDRAQHQVRMSEEAAAEHERRLKAELEELAAVQKRGQEMETLWRSKLEVEEQSPAVAADFSRMEYDELTQVSQRNLRVTSARAETAEQQLRAAQSQMAHAESEVQAFIKGQTMAECGRHTTEVEAQVENHIE